MDALLPTLYLRDARSSRTMPGATAASIRSPPSNCWNSHRRDQRVHLPDRPEDDDEGRSASARALRPAVARPHERGRSGRRRGLRLVSRRPRRGIVNEMFGQTEINYIVGNAHRPVACDSRDRSDGRIPATASRSSTNDGRDLSRSVETGDIAAHRRDLAWRTRTRCSSSAILEQSRSDGREVRRGWMVPHRRPGLCRRGRRPLVPGSRRRHVQGRGLSHRTVRDRELPGASRSGRERGRGAESPTPSAAM